MSSKFCCFAQGAGSYSQVANMEMVGAGYCWHVIRRQTSYSSWGGDQLMVNCWFGLVWIPGIPL